MQLRAERIDLSATPLPTPQQDVFMVTVDLHGNTVRPRRLDFVVDAACAMAIWRLQRNGYHATRFAMVPTGRRCGFMPLEEVRFDTTGDVPTFAIADVHTVAQFRF